MHNRLRLLRVFTALLYFGPALAGLMGQGWGMVLAFAALFLLWSVILRPHLWPTKMSDLRRSLAAVALAALVATQLLLVIVCFGLGRGIGGVLALKPDLPAFLPLALSFLALPLSRMIWNPRAMADTAGLNPILPRRVPSGDDPSAPVAEMLAQVMALPEDVAEDDVQAHLTAISAHLDPVVIRARWVMPSRAAWPRGPAARL